MCLSKYSYMVSTGVFRYLVHVPAAENLHSGVCIAALILVVIAMSVGLVVAVVPVVAPTPVMGNTVAAKNVAAGEMKSV